MSKKEFDKLPLVYPLPAVVIGTVSEGKVNYTTIGNCGIISVRPSIIYISMHHNHCSSKAILVNQSFSINVPSVDMTEKVDYCGIVSGNNVDKSQVFHCFYKDDDTIPMITDCPVNLACKVIKEFVIEDMEVFIGAVQSTYVNEEFLSNRFPDTAKINPLLYCMDNQYWSLGNRIGTAFKIGKDDHV